MPVGVQPELSSLVFQTLSRHFERVGRKVHELLDPLHEDLFWRRPFPYGNSVGHLLLHLTGNLNYYIGAQIMGTGYVRERQREFTDASQPAKEAVLRSFDSALQLVQQALAAQSEADWAAAYEAIGKEDVGNRLTIFLRCAAHADHHLGQLIYLRKELERARRE